MAAPNGDTTWRLPIAWVGFLILQTGGGFFWAASMQTRLDSIERSGSSIASTALSEVRNVGGRLSVVEATLQQIPINSNRITRLETQFDSIEASLEHLTNILDGSPQGPTGPAQH